MTQDSANSLPLFIKKHSQGWVVQVVVAPRAKRSSFLGFHGGLPRISVAASPIDGRANEELMRFIAELLGVANQSIQLLRGDSSKYKSLLIMGVPEETICKAFQVAP